MKDRNYSYGEDLAGRDEIDPVLGEEGSQEARVLASVICAHSHSMAVWIVSTNASHFLEGRMCGG